MDIKILIAMHKPYWTPTESVYYPIKVGKDESQRFGVYRDNVGDNIAVKNPEYCELTAIYWAWKNLSADYIGLVHYRRYFTRKGFFLRSVEKKRRDILSTKEWEEILAKNDIVVADRRKYRIQTNQEHYLAAHPREQFDAAKSVIEEKYPEYKKGWDIMMNRTWAHMFNMFVMKKSIFDEFCEWWFDVMAEVEARVDLSSWPKSERRWFIDEILLDVWLETKGYFYKEVNVDYFERQNWVKKIGKFIKRKFHKKNK